MRNEQEREPSVADALQRWREAERNAVRSTAQREAADEAIASAELAEEAAKATAKAAAAAQVASSEAARAAAATAEAAHTVTLATRTHDEARRILESEALAAEQEAKSIHNAAQDRAFERTRGQGEEPRP